MPIGTPGSPEPRELMPQRTTRAASAQQPVCSRAITLRFLSGAPGSDVIKPLAEELASLQDQFSEHHVALRDFL